MLWVILFLLILGFTLLFVEFYVPGGVLGSAGVVSLAVSLLLIFFEYGLFWGSCSSITVIVVVAFLLHHWMETFQRSFFGRRMVLNTEVADDVFYDTLKSLVGSRGTTSSPLRPSGTAVIEGKKYDVVAEVGLINSGTDVEVVKVEGINVVVRPVEAA